VASAQCYVAWTRIDDTERLAVAKQAHIYALCCLPLHALCACLHVFGGLLAPDAPTTIQNYEPTSSLRLPARAGAGKSRSSTKRALVLCESNDSAASRGNKATESLAGVAGVQGNYTGAYKVHKTPSGPVPRGLGREAVEGSGVPGMHGDSVNSFGEDADPCVQSARADWPPSSHSAKGERLRHRHGGEGGSGEEDGGGCKRSDAKKQKCHSGDGTELMLLAEAIRRSKPQAVPAASETKSGAGLPETLSAHDSRWNGHCVSSSGPTAGEGAGANVLGDAGIAIVSENSTGNASSISPDSAHVVSLARHVQEDARDDGRCKEWSGGGSDVLAEEEVPAAKQDSVHVAGDETHARPPSALLKIAAQMPCGDEAGPAIGCASVGHGSSAGVHVAGSRRQESGGVVGGVQKRHHRRVLKTVSSTEVQIPQMGAPRACTCSQQDFEARMRALDERERLLDERERLLDEREMRLWSEQLLGA
jgi:hypothetical protein